MSYSQAYCLAVEHMYEVGLVKAKYQTLSFFGVISLSSVPAAIT